MNDPSRRFCERCGFTLVTPAPSVARTPGSTSTSGRWWWSRSSEERAARRAYRRSLPPLYRWRRVIVSLLVVLLAIVVVSVVEGNPVTWAMQRYYDVVDKKIAVTGVSATTDPGGTDMRAAVDDDPTTVWKTPWPRGATDLTSCTDSTSSLRLEWSKAVRVRGLRVSPGLREENNDRLLHPQPTTLLVSWPSGTDEPECVVLEIGEGAQPRDLDLDTVSSVDTLWVAVGAAEDARNATVARPAVIRDLSVLRRP